MNKRLIAATALATVLSGGAAFAHATFANQPVEIGKSVAATLQVPHGCSGKATNEVQIKIPEGFISAKPMPKAGWDVEVITGDYQKTYSNHGREIKSGPVEIRFKNGALPDNFYDTFVIYGRVAEADAAVGLAFPTVQLCGADDQVAWDQIPAAGQDPHDLDRPAPVLAIVAAATGGHGHAHGMQHADASGHGAHGSQGGHDAHAGHGDHAGHMDGGAAVDPGSFEPVVLGDLTLSAAYTRAMLPGQPVGGGFITIANSGASDDVLVSASSPTSGEVQLHEMAMEGDVMRMRQLAGGISVPAGSTVELKPGGLHLMFMQVKEPFVEGATVPLTLTFEKAGAVDVTLPVVPARGK